MEYFEDLNELANDVYDKTGGYCYYCGKRLAFYNRLSGMRAAWHMDHVIPLSRGGRDTFRNLFPACDQCNLEKGDMTGAEFRRYLRQRYGLR